MWGQRAGKATTSPPDRNLPIVFGQVFLFHSVQPVCLWAWYKSSRNKVHVHILTFGINLAMETSYIKTLYMVPID